MENIIVSKLSHTWILDLDGTIVKHNGYLSDGEDSLLPGVQEFFASIPVDDMIIILTSRNEMYRERTLSFLRKKKIRYDYIIFGVPYGERIIINDRKPSGLQSAIAVNVTRDDCVGVKIMIDEKL